MQAGSAFKVGRGSEHATPASAGLGPPVARNERATPLPGDDQPALAKYLHGAPDRLVGDAVLLGQIAFGGQLVGDFPGFDAHGYGVRHLVIGEIGPKRIHWRRTHVIKVCTSPSCLNTS
jgi:hypothetical protein